MENLELKRKSDLHLARKIWHAAGVASMVLFYNYFGIVWSWIALTAAALTIIPFDLLRLRYPSWNRLAIRILGRFMRRHEKHSTSGITFLICGTIVLLLLFKKDIVTLTLLFLAFGDPIASFFGIRFGRDKIIGNKTLQGTMAAFVVCSTIAAIYYYAENIMTERIFIVAPLSGLIGAMAELIPVGRLDDNLTFPIICSILLAALFQLFGGFSL